jgi:hypothetical protein
MNSSSRSITTESVDLDEEDYVETDEFSAVEETAIQGKKLSKTFERQASRSRGIRQSKRESLGMPVEDEHYEEAKKRQALLDAQAQELNSMSGFGKVGGAILSAPGSALSYVFGGVWGTAASSSASTTTAKQ